MSMPGNHDTSGFADDPDGSLWPAVWIGAAMVGLAVFAWGWA